MYGARTADDNVRSNATLVLGNVIDNQSVCVPLDHLYDSVLGAGATSYHIRGRANLLGVVSVVAPWAYKENYANIRTMWKYMDIEIASLKSRPELQQTFQILENIDLRLKFQDQGEQKGQAVNKNTLLPRDLDACKHYRPKWALERLKY